MRSTEFLKGLFRVDGKKRRLVTGGAKVRGFHPCERLSARGRHVLCVDNHLTGRRDDIVGVNWNRIAELLPHDVAFARQVEVGDAL